MDAETIYLLGVRDALIIAGMNKIDATAAVVRMQKYANLGGVADEYMKLAFSGDSASVLAATADLHV